jgi:hypothetical protein
MEYTITEYTPIWYFIDLEKANKESANP